MILQNSKYTRIRIHTVPFIFKKTSAIMNSFDTRLLDNWYQKVRIRKERLKIERLILVMHAKKDQE